MKIVNYDKSALSTVNKLGIVTPSVIFKKDEDGVVLRRANAAESIAYELKMKNECLDFVGDELAFYNFQEFFQLFSCFEDPTIKQKIENEGKEDEKTSFIISKDKSKILYKISEPTSLKPSPSEFPSMDDSNLNYLITAEELKELQKMKGLLSAGKLKITMKEGLVVMELFNSSYDNSFDKEYTVQNSTVEELDLIMSSDILDVLPSGDYEIKVKKEGIVSLTLKNANVDLIIFTAELEDE